MTDSTSGTIAPTATLPDGRTVRLGRILPAGRPQALSLARYFNPSQMRTPPPASVDYATKAMPALRRMYLNDQYGDCVIASRAHGFGVWTGNDLGTPLLATDAEILSAYHTICGAGDNGCQMTDVLDYTKSTGLMLGGTRHKIDGYVSVDTRNQLLTQVAIYLFGGLAIGFNLPQEWVDNAREGAIWDTPKSLKSPGGHEVYIIDFNQIGVRVATWSLLITITYRALANTQIFQECYAMLSKDWYNDDRVAPCGVDADELAIDLPKVGGGEVPPINPPVVVPPGEDESSGSSQSSFSSQHVPPVPPSTVALADVLAAIKRAAAMLKQRNSRAWWASIDGTAKACAAEVSRLPWSKRSDSPQFVD